MATMTYMKCPRCEKLNPVDTSKCIKCTYPLHLAKVEAVKNDELLHKEG